MRIGVAIAMAWLGGCSVSGSVRREAVERLQLGADVKSLEALGEPRIGGEAVRSGSRVSHFGWVEGLSGNVVLVCAVDGRIVSWERKPYTDDTGRACDEYPRANEPPTEPVALR